MANVKFPRDEVEKALGRKLSDETLAKIALFGCPVESLTDDEIELEIFPNRPDLLSTEGFLRSFKAFIGKEPGIKTYKIKKAEKDYKVKIDPSVKDVRPFTACAIVRGLSFNDQKIKTLIDLQEKLHSTLGRNRKKFAIGVYPLEKIKLPITYKALPPKQIKFVPLESDREMDGLQILAKHPTGKEYAHLLEGKDKFPVFTDASGKILSMPPIINSHETGKVSEETKDVFVECSGFDQAILNKTLNIVITTLADMGGSVYEMDLVSSKKLITPDLSPEKMPFSIEKANKLLGTKFKDTEIPKLLAKMGLGFQGKSAIIPAWRTDVLHEVDIIEELAIAYGYESLEPEVPQVSTVAEENQEDKFRSKIKEILVGLGLLEISSFHMIKQNEAELVSLKEPIEVENSKTEYKILRPNLLVPALRILTENKDHEYPQDFFEVGTVFAKDEKQETGIKESSNLLVLQAPGNFTKAKQTLTYLFSSLGLDFSLKENSHPQLVDGRSASILLEDKEIGYLGELHPSTLKAWTIKMPAAVMEIDLEEVFEELKK